MYQAESGYYYDIPTGCSLCGQRFYEPTFCRWLNRDPASYGGGTNLYGYCGGNPVAHSDSSGLDETVQTGLGPAADMGADGLLWLAEHGADAAGSAGEAIITVVAEDCASVGQYIISDGFSAIDNDLTLPMFGGSTSPFATGAPNIWPAGDGEVPGTVTPDILRPGEVFDKYFDPKTGSVDTGRFLAELGTPHRARGIPENYTGYQAFLVTKPIECFSSLASNAFGGGGGVQYLWPSEGPNIASLLKSGDLVKIQ